MMDLFPTMDPMHCPDCPQGGSLPPAIYTLQLLTNNAEVRTAFPELRNSYQGVHQQKYCRTHYVAAYKRFHPAGGVHMQWKDVGPMDPNEGLLPS